MGLEVVLVTVFVETVLRPTERLDRMNGLVRGVGKTWTRLQHLVEINDRKPAKL